MKTKRAKPVRRLAPKKNAKTSKMAKVGGTVYMTPESKPYRSKLAFLIKGDSFK